MVLRAWGRGAAVLVALLAMAGAGCGGDAPASTAAPALVTVGPGLSAPAGTTVTALVDGPVHVAALARDGSGRLWLGTAAADGSPTDGVYLVAGGAATTTEVDAATTTEVDAVSTTEVVGGLRTVLGLLWVDDTLYVASGGGVDAYRGFDGTSFAERRTVLALPEGTGEANGLAATADGRIWLGISAPCDACPTACPTGTICGSRPPVSGPRSA